MINVSLEFKKKTYSELDDFCRQVIQKMDGSEAYVAEKLQVDIVKPLLESYQNAVAAASDGGKFLTQVKRESKTALLNEMHVLALQVQLNAKEDDNYVIGAGFTTVAKAKRHVQPFEQPQWKSIRRGVLSGTVECEVMNKPKGVNEIGVTYSTDGWQTVHNGTYSSAKKFIIKGLPTRQDVEFRLQFIGTHQRKSDPSPPIGIFVL